MATPHAGSYGPEPFIDKAGNSVPTAVIAVHVSNGGALATLYADRNRATPLANPLPVGVAEGSPGLDGRANASFFADPGVYWMVVTVLGVTVWQGPVRAEVDPADADVATETTARIAADAAEAAARAAADASEASARATADNLRVLKAEVALNIVDFGIVGDGVANDAANYQAAINQANATGRPLYHPGGKTCYLGSTSLIVPSGLVWFGDGYHSLLTSDRVGTYDAVQAHGKDHFWISGLRCRRTNALAGTEGPFDCGFDVQNCTDFEIADCIVESFSTCVGIFACQRFELRNVVGYSNADCHIRINPAGANSPGMMGSRLVDCWSYDCGFQLDGVTPVPNPSGPLGSSILCTDHELAIVGCGAINPRYQSFESGANPDRTRGIMFDGFVAMATKAGRSAGLNCADLFASKLHDITLVALNGGVAPININATSESVDVGPVLGYGLVGVGANGTTKFVRIHDVFIDGMGTVAGCGIAGNAGAPMTLEDVLVKNVAHTGSYNVGGSNPSCPVVIRRVQAWDCGNTPVNVDSQIGIVVDGGYAIVEDCIAGDTRVGAARTMIHGFYLPNSICEWVNNKSRNCTGSGVRTEANTKLRGRVSQDIVAPASASGATGQVALVAGSKVVNTDAVTANSRIMLSVQSLGTVAAPKALAVTARVAGTSFTITSADGTDTSVVAWEIVEPVV